MRGLACLCVLLLSLLPTGSSGDLAGPAPLLDTHVVTIVGQLSASVYVPPVLMIDAGDSVVWSNQGLGSSHTATASAPATWDTGTVPAGTESAPIVFPVPGTFPYFCRFHPLAMHGVIVVV